MTILPNDTFITIPAQAGIQGWRGMDSRPRIGVRGRLRGSGLDLFRPSSEEVALTTHAGEVV